MDKIFKAWKESWDATPLPTCQCALHVMSGDLNCFGHPPQPLEEVQTKQPFLQVKQKNLVVKVKPNLSSKGLSSASFPFSKVICFFHKNFASLTKTLPQRPFHFQNRNVFSQKLFHFHQGFATSTKALPFSQSLLLTRPYLVFKG